MRARGFYHPSSLLDDTKRQGLRPLMLPLYKLFSRDTPKLGVTKALARINLLFLHDSQLIDHARS